MTMLLENIVFKELKSYFVSEHTEWRDLPRNRQDTYTSLCDSLRDSRN